MGNHLQHETSPYLLQHADNPVDWYPWGEEAFARARQEDKPVFLSIGYSTCHWCHVMAHESFEDTATAAILNQYFISIKVDREERPDIDSVYMAVCQAFTGSGGWPTSVFLTPEQKPFFAGTYFPVVSRRGMIGFRDLLQAIAARWEESRSELLRSGDEIIGHLQRRTAKSAVDSRSLPDNAFEFFSDSFDEKYGGFGSAPKFPSPHNLLYLLAYSQMEHNGRALDMVETTLIQMRKGGIFDQIGFGFSRYSTDRFFLAPHFEKMLYDNALLMLAYTAAYAVTRKAVYLDTAEKTAVYILREMTGPEGGFYSAQDADSSGIEGKYYLFDYDEILSVLGKETGIPFASYYGITRKGNFEGGNIPNRLHTNKAEADNAFDDALPILYDYRRNRESLLLDDKILTSWNALMIAAFSLLYRVTGKADYLTAARNANRFIEENLTDGGRLFVSWRNGERRINGLLDDYAFYAAALILLFESTADRDYLRKAAAFCREAMDQFADRENGGYKLNGRYNEPLVLTPRETYDGAVPSGNAMLAYAFVRLSQLSDDAVWQRAADEQLSFLSGEAKGHPAGHSMFLLALLIHRNPPPTVTVVLPSGVTPDDISGRLPFYADITVRCSPDKEYPLLNDRITYYVCRGQVCLPPTNTL